MIKALTEWLVLFLYQKYELIVDLQKVSVYTVRKLEKLLDC